MDTAPRYADGQTAQVGDHVRCLHKRLYVREMSADLKWARLGCRDCPVDYWELADRLEQDQAHG